MCKRCNNNTQFSWSLCEACILALSTIPDFEESLFYIRKHMSSNNVYKESKLTDEYVFYTFKGIRADNDSVFKVNLITLVLEWITRPS